MSGPRIGSLFSGYGGLELGVQAVLGGDTVWHVEFDEGPSRVLAHHWPGVPNYGDITSVDWSKVEPVDILTGGFPCQDVSLAGSRRGLRKGTRSGLWAEFARAIGELRPGLVLIENVRGLLSADGEPWHEDLIAAGSEVSKLEVLIELADKFIHCNPSRSKEGRSAHVDRWRRARVRMARQRKRAVARFDRERRLVRRAIDTVLRDLADMGFNAEWGGLRAADAGAPHGRFRVFILAWPADADGDGREAVGRFGGFVERDADGRDRAGAGAVADAAGARRGGREDAGAGGGYARSRARGVESERGDLPDAAGGESVGESAEQPRRAAAPGSRGDADADTDSGGQRPDVADVRGRERHSGGGAAEDADLAARGERGQSASVEAEGGRSRADVGGRGGASAVDTSGERLGEQPGGASAEKAGSVEGDEPADNRGSRSALDWGPYARAIARWELVTGRVAPAPTRPDGKNGQHRLSPLLVEWMMGLPLGWVTDPTIWVGMSDGAARNAQLKALGNGVVWQQAALALTLLLARMP